jgi:hypothetical protein
VKARRPIGALPALVVVLVAAGPGAAGADELAVVDPEGRPVGGARVELWALPATGSVFERIDPRLAAGETGPDGTVSLRVPRLGELLLVVDPPAHPPLLLPVSSPPPARLTLAAGSVLAGQARRRGGGEALAPRARPAEGEGWAVRGRACARWSRDLPGLDRARSWERCAPLSPGGGFSIAGLPAAPVELTVAVSGFLPARRGATPGGEPLGVELERGVRVAGKVLGRRGRPVPGATVEAAPGLAVESGEDGAFLLAVPSLPVELTVEAEGYLAAREPVRARAEPPEVVIQLDPGQVVSGELLGDGEPIEEATFRIHRHLGGSEWTTASRTEGLAEGAFRLALPAPGRYRLRVQAAGYRETVVPELAVGAGEEIALGALVVARGAGARGRLVDAATGEGVPGGVVELRALGSQILEQALRSSSPRAISDEDGSFLLTGLEAGSYDLRARVAGRAPALRELDLAQDQVRELGELALGEGVRVSGRVSDRAGRPRPAVAVAFYPGDGESLLPLEERTTDGDGRFEGPALSPGRYQVRVHGERQLLAQRVEVPEGADRLELDLTAGGVSLHGLVIRGGAPVDGGLLVFASQLDPGLRRGVVLVQTGGGLRASPTRFNAPESETAAEVGPDGTFAVADAPVGTLLARFYGSGSREVTRRVQVPDQPEAWVVIELGGAELAGTVVDDATESGIEASIRLLGASGEPAGVAASDAAGRFVLADLEPGRYRIEVTAEGYRPFVAADLRVAPGRAPVLVRLARGATGALAVELRRSDGSPLSRVQLSLLDAGGVMVRSLLSDWNGEKRFQDLPEGAYALVWSDTLAGTGASPPIAVVAGETARYCAVLPAAPPVRIDCAPALCAGEGVDVLQVLVPAGIEITPYLAGAQVGMRFSDGGELALGRLSPGRYLLRVGAGALRAERLLDVRGSEVVVALE